MKSIVPVPERLIVSSILSCYYFHHGKCLGYSWNDDTEGSGSSVWPGIFFAMFLRREMRGKILYSKHGIEVK